MASPSACFVTCRQSNDPPIIDNVVTLEPVQLLGSGQGGDVFADATGTLAIKLIMRRAYEEEDSFNARFELGCREGFLLDRLKASGRRPAFYGAFEADDEDILALVFTFSYAGDAIRELLKIHRLDVRHDDLRPANFVLAEDEGTVFLVDFGHADYDDRPALLQDEKLKLAKKLFPHLSDDSLARLLDEADAYL
ncbi:mitogen-activated protein kinase [Rhodotorula kratochvilovae]